MLKQVQDIMSFLRRFRTPVYPNTGSVARDQLALERTFLAWLRTGLGFVALGIAIERFSQLDIPELIQQLKEVKPVEGSPPPPKPPLHHKTNEKVLVGALLSTGAGSIAYGISRHFSTMRHLEKGIYKPAYYGAAGLGLAVTGLAGASFWNMVVVNRRLQERLH